MKISITRTKQILALCMGIFGLLPVVSFKARMFSWIAMLLLMIVEMVFDKRRRIDFNIFFVVFLLFGAFSTFVCLSSEMPQSWKTNAFNCYKNMFVISIFVFLNGPQKVRPQFLEAYIKGLRISCIIQIIWCYAQFLLYKITGTNLTELVFRDIFGTYDMDTIFYSAQRMSVTGLSWHPAQLVPIVVVSYCLFDSRIIRILVLGVALISSNSSCLIAISCCIGLDIIFKIKEIKKMRKKTILFLLVFICLGMLLVLSNSDVLGLLFERLNTTIIRVMNLFDNNNGYFSNSTYLHIRYYLGYPKIAEFLGPIKTIFGIGFDNGGYPYSKVFGQYTYLDLWTPESDVMNILVGRGWAYFAFYYIWLISIAIKGKKKSNYYIIMIISLIIAGIGYNNQFEWLIIVEYFVYIGAEKGIDIFSIEKRKKHFMVVHSKLEENTINE